MYLNVAYVYLGFIVRRMITLFTERERESKNITEATVKILFKRNFLEKNQTFMKMLFVAWVSLDFDVLFSLSIIYLIFSLYSMAN